MYSHSFNFPLFTWFSEIFTNLPKCTTDSINIYLFIFIFYLFRVFMINLLNPRQKYYCTKLTFSSHKFFFIHSVVKVKRMFFTSLQKHKAHICIHPLINIWGNLYNQIFRNFKQTPMLMYLYVLLRPLYFKNFSQELQFTRNVIFINTLEVTLDFYE